MRPHTKDELKLKEQIKVRLTSDEKAEIIRRCGEERFITICDYARIPLFRKRLVKRIEVSDEFVRVFRTLDYDLVKIGTNLNQIAHKMNAFNTYMLGDEDKLVFRKGLEVLRTCFPCLKSIWI